MSLYHDLLAKAIRDTSKLVKVQRTVTRNGKTFTQNFYIKPDQVKTSDKVIGNFQNVLPAAGSVPTPAKGTWDQKYFDSIKADRTKAMDYLKQCGVTWDESDNPGINWMRACMAVKRQFNIATPAQPKPSQTVSPNNGSTTPVQSLDLAIEKELTSCNNGKEKVVVLKKKLGQQGCADYAKSLGVTWDEHSHAAINVMRMSVALRNYFDQVDGTVSPVGTPGGKVGAPKGNDNAKGNKVTDDSQLPIQSNTSQRKANLIKIINGITSIDDLKSYANVGMVPEDDIARSFIMDKLNPKYTAFKAAHRTTTKRKSKVQTVTASPYGLSYLFTQHSNIEGCKKDLVESGLDNLLSKFKIADLTDPRTTLYWVNSDLDDDDGGNKHWCSRANNPRCPKQIIDHLIGAYSLYTTNDWEVLDGTDIYHNDSRYMTNLGYTGWDGDVHRDRYDREKDGFVRYLNLIATKNPEYQQEVDRMVSVYEEMMELVDYNPKALSLLLGTTELLTKGDFQPRYGTFYYNHYNNLNPASAQATLREIQYQADMLPKIIVRMQEKYPELNIDVKTTLRDTWQSLDNYVLKDEQGNRQLTLNLNDEIDPDTGKPYFKYVSYYTDDLSSLEEGEHPSRTSSQILSYIYQTYTGESDRSYENIKETIKELQWTANVTPELLMEVQNLSYKLFGVTPAGPSTLLGVLDYDTFKSGNFKLRKDDTVNTDIDYVLANLNMAALNVDSNLKIARNVDENARSKVNNDGRDYSQNFSFYFPTDDQKIAGTRRKCAGIRSSSRVEYSLEELNDKIQQQLNDVPMVSVDYLNNLKDYYNAKGNYDSEKIAALTSNQASTDMKDDPDDNHAELTMDSVNDNPLKDVLFEQIKNILHYIPRMDNEKLPSLLQRRFNYMPYDFSSVNQPRFLKSAKPAITGAKNELRKAREELLKAANCSIAVEDEATSLQMRKDFLKRWDYSNSNNKDPDGNSHQKMFDGGPHSDGNDRRALFNSRFFRVNNSNMEEDFDKYKQELEVDGVNTDPMELFSATSYGSTAGILGATGGWFMGNQYTKSGKALGNGAYFGYTGGKCSVYCGDTSYANIRSYTPSGDSANGCYILASVMRGRPQDSTSDHSMYRDFEIAVHTNKCIRPHHFVDISCRTLGKNVKRDANGNYLDTDGIATHDRYGTKLDMK